MINEGIKFLRLVLWSLFLLAGCANQVRNSVVQENGSDSIDTKDIQNCQVKLLQNGQELKYQVLGVIRSYQLQSAPFRIEVSSEKCDASIGTFKSINDLMFVASNPYAISLTGMSMAGNPLDDVLIVRSEDPRPTPDYIEALAPYKAEILKLCNDFGRCPTQVFATRTYWPFLIDGNATRGKVADIRKLRENQPISRTLDLVPVVIYTKVRMDDGEYRKGSSNINILETHPMLLLFKGPPTNAPQISPQH